MSSDLSSLVDMGFDKEKSEMALRKGGNLQGAIDWLDKNADRTIEQLKEDEAEDAEQPQLAAGEEARSMICNECQKKFRSMAQAQFHAEKSGHTDFAESTEEIAPLSPEEAKAKLAELRAKAAERKAKQAVEEKKEQRRNEEIRKKHTKESDDAKEELARKEQIKEAAKKRQEKADDIAAKKRIKDKIEADKAARKAKIEEDKRMRDNPDAYNPGAATAPAGGLAAAAPAKVANHSEARLRLQTPSGNIMKTMPAETTLFEVAEAVKQENGTSATSFTQNFPKKIWNYEDFGMTLKEAGLVPSAALIVK
ncbi:Putative UBX domain, UBA-like superfamily, Zinc finger C2H2-type, Ubiquitin-associated [Septoria linicola]|uniref:UBX domain, UBA-like superfamily, Zinc finger C2H2-type, Ubiquitin-associated n=1 Tax=Septoria linicola TaxID=215465 RepID=A0A9Q9ER84_9PEZI|nr:Putative UBX domain, UBA-like superfamily, Zinc finger C2H2-type, Ubiquitin-associated [Septoria linicola]